MKFCLMIVLMVMLGSAHAAETDTDCNWIKEGRTVVTKTKAAVKSSTSSTASKK